MRVSCTRREGARVNRPERTRDGPGGLTRGLARSDTRGVRGRILIVHPDPQRREGLRLALAPAGYEVVCMGDSAATPRALEEDAFDAVLCEADLARCRVRERDHLRRTARGLDQELERAAAARPIVAASPAMIELLEAIERLAAHACDVLLVGEPGTGREALARVLHAQSPRRREPFAALDCRGASPETLERKLFGARGGRAGIPGRVLQADGGTLFVEAIDALPLPLQQELAGVLREERVTPRDSAKPRAVDLRLVASATRPLEARVHEGRFSAALHGRLRAATLRVPALRERREDLPLLIDHGLARACADLGRAVPALGAGALSRLVDHAWPGNLRELESALVAAALRARADGLALRDLPEAIAHGTVPGPRVRDGLALKPARKAFEADWIRAALRAAGGNRTRAARLLEISHRALLYKLKEFEIEQAAEGRAQRAAGERSR